ncbi:MAG: cytochrome c [Methylococcales bacterium]|nr:cytochrome c [Methylococcales bacterium]
MKIKVALGLMLSAATLAAFAGPVEEQIKARQSAYAFLGWNTHLIKSQVSDHPETYNKEKVIAAATVMAAIAKAPLLDLYGPGTDQGTGWKPSHLKADYFQKQDEIRQINDTFAQEAAALQAVATQGEIADIKTQFGKVGAACKSCHDQIRVRD